MAGNANSGPRKAKVWRDALMLTLNREDGDLPERGKTNLESLVLTQVKLALGGDTQSIRDIADRIDGKPAQAIVGGDDDDNPISIINRIELVAPSLNDNSEA